jgi:hypothetical protein
MPSPHPDPRALLAKATAAWADVGALSKPPPGLVDARLALHALAENVLSPARREATGNEIALRWYPGGFGTPPFPDGRGGSRVLRVDGTELVDSEGREGRTLAVDASAARFLGDWFCFGTLAIARLRVDAAAELDPGWVQLWPEHFDVATELGSEAAGRRAAYGASPGDPDHPEPYLYVAPWTARPEGELWNATAFAGAELSYAALRAAPDPVAAAADFFDERVRALTL